MTRTLLLVLRLLVLLLPGESPRIITASTTATATMRTMPRWSGKPASSSPLFVPQLRGRRPRSAAMTELLPRRSFSSSFCHNNNKNKYNEGRGRRNGDQFVLRRSSFSFSSSSSSTWLSSSFSTTTTGGDGGGGDPRNDSTTTTTTSTTATTITSSPGEVERVVDDYADDVDVDDTIYALASGELRKAAGVAVIRLSGPGALPALRALLLRQSSLPKPRVATLRKLYRPATTDDSNDGDGRPRRQVLDQALVLYFPEPNSFTGEDVVELHCHGSRAVVQGVFDALQSLSASSTSSSSSSSSSSQQPNPIPLRMAERGEFAQRAFANGKLDVLQVEALADLLGAETRVQSEQALRQLDGTLSGTYNEWRDELVAGLAHAEAVIDFGDDERLDDDEDQLEGYDDAAQWNVWGGVGDRMRRLAEQMRRQLKDSHRGELVREGVRVAIVGPPNAGKSSLFNLLARHDAAIVSPTAGTTRDVLSVTLNLGGIKCLLQDTAGMRSRTNDDIEVMGMERAARAAREAQIVVAVVDSTEQQAGLDSLRGMLPGILGDGTVDDDDDEKDAEDGARLLLVLNKSDLKDSTKEYDLDASAAKPSDSVPTAPTSGASLALDGISKFEISCVTQEGIETFIGNLTEAVLDRVSSRSSDVDGADSDEGNGTTLITRARHRQHVEAAVQALERFEVLSWQGSMAVDMAAEELRLAASELGRVTGVVDVEDVLDKLFADFCIGK